MKILFTNIDFLEHFYDYGVVNILNFCYLGEIRSLGVLGIGDHDFFVIFSLFNMANPIWRAKCIQFIQFCLTFVFVDFGEWR